MNIAVGAGHSLDTLVLGLTWSDLIDPSFLIGSIGVLAGIYVIFTLGLQLNVGHTGIINFGQAGFMAVGAYAMAILTVESGLAFPLALAAAILITVSFALVVGLVTVRLRADYLAIATIAAAEIVRLLILNLPDLTGGTRGFACNVQQTVCYDDAWRGISGSIENAVVHVFGTNVDTLFPLFLVIWAVALVLTLTMSLLQRTAWGRVLHAIREDEDAAQAVGKNTLAYKLQSLAISAALGAIAGFFFALNLATLSPLDFEPLFTFVGFAALLIGGLGSYWGVIFGAIILWFLMEATRSIGLPISPEQEAALRFVLVGVVLILLMAFRPQGLFGKREEMVLGG